MNFIDETGFEFGMPTRLELLEHQCQLLCSENEQLRRDLACARRNIDKLVTINQQLQAQATAESRRANLTHVHYVNIANRIRTEHGIDIGQW